MICGASQVDITPSQPVHLAGYGERNKPSEGVHDPLMGAVLFLQDTITQTLLIGLDLIGVDAEFTSQARAEIEKGAGIPAQNIAIACTHTHSGPMGTANTFPREEIQPDIALRTEIIGKLTQAARDAKQKACPAKLAVGKCPLTGIGLNRNDPHKIIDTELTIVSFSEGNRPIAVLVNYGCHPTVMSAKNYLISADFPGAARSLLNQQFPDAVFLFTNSGAGDVSTRFARQGQGFEEVQRFGKMYADAVQLCMSAAEEVPALGLKMKTTSIQLPIRAFPNPREAQQMLIQAEADFAALKDSKANPADIRAAETKVFGARTQVRLAEMPFPGSSVAAEMQIFALGDFIYITLPGEPFSGVVWAIKAAFPDKKVIVLSYANDYKGYFPIAEGEQTYETLKSPFPADIGDRISNQAITLLKEFLNEK